MTDLAFEIAPDGAPWPGSAIRHLPVSQPIAVGRTEVTITWDGRDDNGQQAAPGSYRLFSAATTTTERIVACLDGSGPGRERFADAFEGGGVGVLVVTLDG